ncbi:MAG: ABC transporter permease [Candidatus Promineifilaceae bacterium]|nr:ABC transporter permease [Candidatus Promineifilaceae bacterium]
MSSITQFMIRTSSFLRKEMAEIIRQPRLVATLILGPFLILLIFGVGYRNTVGTKRIVLIVPEESTIKEDIEDIAKRLSGAVELVAILPTREEGIEMLTEGEIDLVLVTPVDPYADISQSVHAEMEIIHHEIDPLEQIYVNTLERAYIESVNRLLTVKALDKAKEETQPVLDRVKQTRDTATQLRRDLQDGNGRAAATGIVTLVQDFEELGLALSSSFAVYEGVESLNEEDELQPPLEVLDDAKRILADLEGFDEDQSSYNQEITQVAVLEAELSQMDRFLSRFTEVDSSVLARPFVGNVVPLAGTTFGPIDFYVPGVISLLLQHIALTLAALAIVRERVGGSIELFRAAPISAFETLFGKTISFLILSGFLATILSLLVILGLRVPMLGSWFSYAVVVFALLYTSLAMGFAISSISQTDSQAVQYAMIVLLASIFFSGFFISLSRLLSGVHVVSWLLPATYGTAMLQDVMLRGLTPDPILLLGLFGYGFLLFLFGWWRMRRLMARE